jgi:hypothetical protein
MKQRIMNTTRVCLAMAVLGLAGALYLAQARPPFNPRVIPPQTTPGDKSYGEWGAEWWKWALARPFDQSPINDPDGRYGSLGQSGSVWFLAGTFGAEAERTITIPVGKMIFFPIVNIFNDYPCPDPAFQPPAGQTMEQWLTEGAMWWVSHVTEMAATVDGVALNNLWNYRGISPMTVFTADPSQVAMDPCITGQEQLGVSDGYWIMLAPLPPGQHTIRFTATQYYPEWDWQWNLVVTYNVTVK